MSDYFEPIPITSPSGREVAEHYYKKALEVVQDRDAYSRLGSHTVLVWLHLADLALRLEAAL